MFQRTTAINKIKKMTARKKVIQGSTSAGKTHGIIPIIADRSIKQRGIKATIVAETVPAVKDGCVDIFKSVMQDTNRWIGDHWIGNPMEYTFASGSRMQFKSFDSVGKAKAAGKRDILFINEGNHIPYPIADALMVRSKEVYIDFNADEEFWAHTEVLTEPNSEFLSLTYLDNEACPEEILEELVIKKSKAFHDPNLTEEKGLLHESNIKDAYWANWWRVYGMGKIGTYSERKIYNFSITDAIPEGVKRIPSGMDFGQSPDPTILVDAYIDGVDLYLDEIFCENNLIPEKIKGAERESIVDRLNTIALDKVKQENLELDFNRESRYYLEKGQKGETEADKVILSKLRAVKSWLIIGDSSGRTELLDMKAHGYNARGVKKGKGSKYMGIKELRGYNIIVTKRSKNLISGFQSWFWKTDANGKIVPEPDGHEPDGLAAARYIVMAKKLW
jgi:phage terminase large subunit